MKALWRHFCESPYTSLAGGVGLFSVLYTIATDPTVWSDKDRMELVMGALISSVAALLGLDPRSLMRKIVTPELKDKE